MGFKGALEWGAGKGSLPLSILVIALQMQAAPRTAQTLACLQHPCPTPCPCACATCRRPAACPSPAPQSLPGPSPAHHVHAVEVVAGGDLQRLHQADQAVVAEAQRLALDGHLLCRDDAGSWVGGEVERVAGSACSGWLVATSNQPPQTCWHKTLLGDGRACPAAVSKTCPRSPPAASPGMRWA